MNDLKKPNLNKPVFSVFPDAAKAVQENKCPTCGNEITEFKDELSRKEYSISGICQACQDSVFNEEEE